MDCMAQVNAAGSWNPNGSWNTGKQRDAPWRDHPNFRWGEGNSNQSNPPHNTYNGPSSQDTQPNWSGRNQQNLHPSNSNQNSAYVPPHERGYQNHQNHQPPHYQNHPGPNHHQHHNPNQPNNYFSNQNQQGSQPQFQHNHGPPNNYQPHPSFHYNSYNQPNLTQPSNYQNQPKPAKSMEELMGELLSSQQHLQSNVQSNNDVVHSMQNAQKEHMASMDMLAKQMSQLATSMNEMRGNEGKLPASVRLPDRANVSQITLRLGKEYKGPEMKVVLGESREVMDAGDELTKRNGREDGRNIEHIEG